MGLAAPRKRTKISHDPNNVNWSRSTSGFGHRILSAQGWTPGSYLGARNAAHADMFTSASASHIRVSLKDDTLGLGARPKRDALDEPTGLDAFKGLLGRLNGKSDAALEEEQRKREDIKLARYAASKWQSVRFISGGLLVQEKFDSPRTSGKGRDGSSESASEKSRDTASSKHPTVTVSNSSDSQPVAMCDKKSRKKSSRSKGTGEDEKSERKQKRANKRKRSEETDSSDPRKQSTEDVAGAERAAPVKHEPLPSTDAPREHRPMGRDLIRGRHIAQKKRALLDDRSLNEIFMVKS